MICGDLVGYLVGSRVHTGWCTVDAYHGIIPKCGGASQIFVQLELSFLPSSCEAVPSDSNLYIFPWQVKKANARPIESWYCLASPRERVRDFMKVGVCDNTPSLFNIFLFNINVSTRAVFHRVLV